MNTIYRRRLVKEIHNVEHDASPYYSIYVQPDNIYAWSVNIHSLNDSRHKGKNYEITITIPNNYPFIPPSIKFITPLSLDCINRRTGEFSIDLLRDNWSPSLTVEHVILTVCSVITDNEPTRRSPRLNYI